MNRIKQITGYASLSLLVCSVVLSIASAARADSVTVKINAITASGKGDSLGTVKFEDSKYGMLIWPDLHGLTPGNHGFHIHAKPACGPGEKEGKQAAGIAAGGHLDPANTKKHMGPYTDDGHLGDLPSLAVGQEGNAKRESLAPKLKVQDIKGHSVIIHEGGDNYSDQPKELGGGGPRIACGVVE
jgi:Cu-Zn family superoxide dismutase